MDRDRNDSGRYDDRIPPGTVLEAFDDRDDLARPLMAGDVADALGIARRTAHNKLNALVERGELETRKVGARGRVWWLPIPAGDHDQDGTRDAAQDAESGSGARADRSGRPQPTTPPTVEDDPDRDGDTDTVGAALSSIDTPGGGETARKREQALRRAYEYLQQQGEAQRKDFEDLLGDDVGYNGGFRSWWTNYVKAKDALKQLPNVDPPGEGEHTWYYTGDTDPLAGDVYDPTEEY